MILVPREDAGSWFPVSMDTWRVPFLHQASLWPSVDTIAMDIITAGITVDITLDMWRMPRLHQSFPGRVIPWPRFPGRPSAFPFPGPGSPARE
eukprot:356782-Chlamydomonas_euryale.AAC.5